MITPEYRALNAELHRTKFTYGSSGHLWARDVETFASEIGAKRILDYGCGKATLSKALADFDVRNYDPCIPEYATPPSPAELVVCTDVLEHIEPDKLDAVLNDIIRLSSKGAFLVAATRPAKKILPDGRNAHLIIESHDWWIDKITSIMPVSMGINDQRHKVSIFYVVYDEAIPA